jgi:hypothetical protein
MQLASQITSPVTPAPTPSVVVTPVAPQAAATTTAAPVTTATTATKNPSRKPVWQKQIPTLVGVLVLVGALIVGITTLGGGVGVFAPRATPQTTPKQVKITNIGDKSFSVSFYTDEATAGFVKYGSAEGELKLQASDDRDQLAGSVSKFSLHHVTVKGLKPNTSYFFTLGTGSGSSFDNNGAPFKIKTAVDPGTPPPAAKTVYGSVMNAGGTPAEGSIVYLAAEGGGELSTLVKSSGSWAISLANARMTDGSNYLEITDATPLTIFAQGMALAQTAKVNALVSESQPLPDLALAVGGGSMAKTTAPVSSDSANVATAQASDSATTALDVATTASDSATAASESASPTGSSLLGGTTTSTMSATAKTASPSAVLDLETLATAKPGASVFVEDPVVIGVAAPKVKVKIEIHSDTEITQTVTADADGNFELDVSQFQDLEPGEHTVTYSYIDPNTNEEITKTHTFTVAAKAGSDQLAQANTAAAGAGSSANSSSSSSTTYGSGNPFPITSPTKAGTMSAGATTRSAVVSTTSGTYNSGSVGATFALLAGGFFLMAIGWWSWWLAGQVREETA